MAPSRRTHAELALLVVVFLWGLTFPLIRIALRDIDASWFVALRFNIGAACLLPLLARPSTRRELRRALVPGLLLGIVAWGSYMSQTLGLRTIPAGRGAFITGTCVVIVPLLAPLMREGRPTLLDLGAAAIALAGLALLTEPEVSPPSAGDAYVLGCAFLYAVYILLIEKTARRKLEPMSLAFAQLLGVAGASLVPVVLLRPPISRPGGPALAALLACALLATALTFWLQIRYQPDTTPARTALIFTIEPVIAAALAYVLLDERMGLRGILGAVIVLGAVAMPSIVAARVRVDG